MCVLRRRTQQRVSPTARHKCHQRNLGYAELPHTREKTKKGGGRIVCTSKTIHVSYHIHRNIYFVYIYTWADTRANLSCSMCPLIDPACCAVHQHQHHQQQEQQKGATAARGFKLVNDNDNDNDCTSTSTLTSTTTNQTPWRNYTHARTTHPHNTNTYIRITFKKQVSSIHSIRE